MPTTERPESTTVPLEKEILTKRELFAAMAMQGLMSDSDSLLACLKGADEDKTSVPKFVARSAVTYANALIAELEKTK